MSVIRSFVAVNLSPEITQRLEEVIGQFKAELPRVPVRWVQPQNIHLTLKFLGNVSTVNLEMLKDMLNVEVSQYSTFEMSVGEVSAFPSISRPRVIFVGVEAGQELFSVQRSIESGSAMLGYPPEDRAFSPHLTLGRVPRNISSSETRRIAEVLEKTKVGFLGATHIRCVTLYRSDLKPGGAVYTKIVSIPLGSSESG